MTISSYEFCSSKVTSESSGSQVSDESVSLVTSATSSSSQFYDQRTQTLKNNDFRKLLDNPSDDDTMDVDQYWQILWQKHFQEQYAVNYKGFMDQRRQAAIKVCELMSSSLNLESRFSDLVPNPAAFRKLSNNKRKRSRKQTTSDCLPILVANLRIKSEQVDTARDQPADGNEEKKSEQSNANESQVMASYGLPQAFGKLPASSGQASRLGSSGDDRKPPNENRLINLKRSHESDSEESNKDRIRNAFQLMGYAFQDSNESCSGSVTMYGEVVYRKKHIRLHNRALKLQACPKPKLHIHFDEEGNPIPIDSNVHDTASPNPSAIMHSSTDDDDSIESAFPLKKTGSAILVGNLGLSSRNDEGGSKVVKEAFGVTEFKESFDEPVGYEEEDLLKVQKDKKEKKKKRKNKITALLPPEIANDKTLLKYWYKRFSIFSKFDQGIRMDRGNISYEDKQFCLTIFMVCRELVFCYTGKSSRKCCRTMSLRRDCRRVLWRWRKFNSICVYLLQRYVVF